MQHNRSCIEMLTCNFDHPLLYPYCRLHCTAYPFTIICHQPSALFLVPNLQESLSQERTTCKVCFNKSSSTAASFIGLLLLLLASPSLAMTILLPFQAACLAQPLMYFILLAASCHTTATTPTAHTSSSCSHSATDGNNIDHMLGVSV